MATMWCWITHISDHTLALLGIVIAIIAIVISCVAMLDVRRLFRELKHRDETTEERVRTAVLQELNNSGTSIAAFFRACQFVTFAPNELNRESAMLMLMVFRLQQKLAPKASIEELAELRKSTRHQMEVAARGYAEMLVGSGLGTLKEGYEPNPDLGN